MILSLSGKIGERNNHLGFSVIISRIIGGLGNQMFQYAAGRAFSLSSGVPYKQDVEGFDRYTLHNGFELSRVFNVAEDIASPQDLRDVLGWRHHSLLRRYLVRKSLGFLRGKVFIVEPPLSYCASLTGKTLTNAYLVGYWQSEQYFSCIAQTIHSDFRFKSLLTGRNAEFSHRIKNCSSVSLHVRRGDYFSNPATREKHGICTIQYYLMAIEYITARITNPQFFIFSDDIEWARKALSIDLPHHFVEHNKGSESYNDMRLISLCSHHIIANSSFSWWGAWLSPSENKIVIAPRRWYATHPYNPAPATFTLI